MRTIAKYGYAATTLERIAEEIGMSRGHVRHYVGNRENLIRAAAQTYYFGETGKEHFWPAEITSVSAAVEYLFSKEFIGTREENALIFGFIEAARNDSEISQILIKAYLGAEKELAALLQSEHPNEPQAKLKQIAFGVVSMAIHNVFLLDISSQAKTTSLAKSSANLIISTLTEKKEK